MASVVVIETILAASLQAGAIDPPVREDARTHRLVVQTDHVGAIHCMAFSPDGRSIPAYLAIGLAWYAGREFKSMPLAVASATAGVLYLILLALIHSALQSIFQAALYLHARSKLDESHYPDHLLSGAQDYRRR
jgi:hypothetical protein